jgi:ornithine carbamoyltransferase
MINDEAEIERRKPVWAALSDLWLDTELTDDDLQRIAGVMKRSEYSINELRDIYLFEVAPVVFLNLQTVAGEWAGLNEEWLFAEAAKRAKKRSLFLRGFVWSGVGKRLMTFATERHWDRLVELLGEEA